MTDKPDFLPGIYNYCDYMCEKCMNKDRCYLYWSERNPVEAKKDFEKSIEEFGELEVPDDEEWERDPEEKAREKEIDKLCEKRMRPVKVLTNMTNTMMEKIDEKYWKAEDVGLRDALDNISENMFLVSAKFYRAIHGLPGTIDEKPTVYFYGYDAENTLLALKGFLWNFKSGCRDLPTYFPEHKKTCKKLVTMINNFSRQIDEAYLPMVMELKKYDDV